jgi:hypothetical protein
VNEDFFGLKAGIATFFKEIWSANVASIEEELISLADLIGEAKSRLTTVWHEFIRKS